MESNKKQQDKNQIEQNVKNKKNERTYNQTDGFRCDYDDSSDSKWKKEENNLQTGVFPLFFIQ
ncbi:hypothetical protein [Mesobacillus sp.]|uniref:hypothetical protein n=1 Tax=Mesobacillus sp. TaxID=2675271 RepID=UPI0039EF3F59